MNEDDRIQKIFGASLATLAWEVDEGAVKILLASSEAWLNEHGAYLQDLTEIKRKIKRRRRKRP